MKFLVAIITVFLEIFIWWYVIVLLWRTNYLQRSTSIGNDNVIIMYILCAIICLFSAYLIRRCDIPKLFSAILLFLAILVSISFSYMNLSGKVREIIKKETMRRKAVAIALFINIEHPGWFQKPCR